MNFELFDYTDRIQLRLGGKIELKYLKNYQRSVLLYSTSNAIHRQSNSTNQILLSDGNLFAMHSRDTRPLKQSVLITEDKRNRTSKFVFLSVILLFPIPAFPSVNKFIAAINVILALTIIVIGITKG